MTKASEVQASMAPITSSISTTGMALSLIHIWVLKATPYANTLVRVLAEKLIDEERLGMDNDPDLLALNFSCLDYMSRDFTIDSSEEKDMLVRCLLYTSVLLLKRYSKNTISMDGTQLTFYYWLETRSTNAFLTCHLPSATN